MVRKGKPQIVYVSRREMNSLSDRIKTNDSLSSVSRNKVYLTKDATELDKEHELAHIRRKHKKSANTYQYIISELNAERDARRKLGRGDVSKRFMGYTARDAGIIFPSERDKIRSNMNKIARRIGIKHRI